MERHTTANTAGNSLSIVAGGATVGATSKAGGNIYYYSGISTGTGAAGGHYWYGYFAGTTGPVKTFNLQLAGSGYQVNDILTILAGDNNATFRVTMIGGSGQVGAYTLVTGGTGYSVATGISTSGGSGSGCKVNVTSIDNTGDNTATCMGCFRSSTGYFGVGTATPETGIELVGTTYEQSQIRTTRYGGGSGFLIRMANGTVTSPSIVTDGQGGPSYGWAFYDGSAFTTALTLYTLVDGTPDVGSVPVRLSFRLTKEGEAGPSEKVCFMPSGNVGILLGGADPSAGLHVKGDDTTTVTVKVQAVASQTADLQRWLASNGSTIIANLTIDGKMAVGTSASAYYQFYSYYDPTDTEDRAYSAGSFISSASPSGESSATFCGVLADSRLSNNVNLTDAAGGLRGISGTVRHEGTGTLTVGQAFFSYFITTGGGATGSFYHYIAYAPAMTSGTATVMTAFYAANMGHANITNAYGLYIANQSGASSLNYAIYTNAGLVHFGDSVDLAANKNITLSAGNITTDTTTGTEIGTAANQKLGFFGAAPIAQPLLETGTSKSVDEVITVLQNLGLCRQS
jgi:hypothetical protein